MTDDNKETLSITKKEYDALEEIRGLAPDVHSMVMCAKFTESGTVVLEGAPETFEHLISDLSEEIYEELSPKSQLKHLARLYRRLCPDGEFE